MPIALAQKSVFSFKGTPYTVTSVSVEAPQPEVVNMTSIGDTVRCLIMVPTGDLTSPGSINVECLGFDDPSTMVGLMGQAIFSTTQRTITHTAICSSASVDARTGDVLRVRFTLTPTDYVEE